MSLRLLTAAQHCARQNPTHFTMRRTVAATLGTRGSRRIKLEILNAEKIATFLVDELVSSGGHRGTVGPTARGKLNEAGACVGHIADHHVFFEGAKSREFTRVTPVGR